MSSLLRQKDAPFLFLVVVAAFSWTINHIVNRAIERPTLEYSHRIILSSNYTHVPCKDNKKNGNDSPIHQFTIRNISKLRNFSDIDFFVKSNNKTISSVRQMAGPNTILGDLPETCFKQRADFSDITLNPNGIYIIEVSASSDDELLLRVGGYNGAIYLTEPTLETGLVRYESKILLIFLLLTLLVMGLYIKSLSDSSISVREARPETTKKRKPKSDEDSGKKSLNKEETAREEQEGGIEQ